ncbi:MAG: hypothetical protein NVS1B10_02800 [Candidatus Saccharimonadales bacterium]
MNILRSLASTSKDIIDIAGELQSRLLFASKVLLNGIYNDQEAFHPDEDYKISSISLNALFPAAKFVELDASNTNFEMITEGPRLEYKVTPLLTKQHNEVITIATG